MLCLIIIYVNQGKLTMLRKIGNENMTEGLSTISHKVSNSNPSLRILCEEFLISRSHNSESTQKTYGRLIRNHIAPHYDSFNSVDAMTMSRLGHIIIMPILNKGMNSTASAVISLLIMIMNYATLAHEDVSFKNIRNLAKIVNMKKKDEYETPQRAMVNKNIGKNIQYIFRVFSARHPKNKQVNNLLLLSFYLCLRQSEILSIKVKDVNFKRHNLHIAKTKTICYGITVFYLKHMVGDKINDVLLFNFLEIAFEKSNFFNKVNPKLFQKFIYNFSLKDYIKGEIVVPSGHNIGSTFIIVIEGSVSQKGKEKEEYKRGQIIFEKELISFDINSKKKTRLQYDLVADPDCLIMSCNTNQLINLIGCPFKEMFVQSNVLESLSHIPLFKTIPQEKLNYLSKVIKIEKYSDKAFIIKQDDVGDLFYIVKSGKVDIYKDNKYIRTINENGSFGFKALFNKEIRTASAISNGKVECYALSGEEFKKVL